MTIELYAAPDADSSAPIDSPISNVTGELPDQEPTLNLSDLLGSFDSREEALAFVQAQYSSNNQTVTNDRVTPFDPYTHVESLTITVQNGDQPSYQKNYYLVTDEGY